MNKDASQDRARLWPFGRTAATIGLVYIGAMVVLVLSELGVLTDDAWLYLGMSAALMTALCGFFLGYALAVTAEARSSHTENRGSSALARTNRDSLVGARPEPLASGERWSRLSESNR